MKQLKKIIATLLVVVICLTSAPIDGFVAVEWFNISEWFMPKVTAVNELATTGQCGDNVYWNYNKNTKNLIISGTGSMWNYSFDSPFFRCDIKSVVIEKGVTTIGDFVFHQCDSITNVNVSDSVTIIGDGAFASNNNYFSKLTNINIPNSVIKIGYNAFDNCVSLMSIIIPDSVESIGLQAFFGCINLKEIHYWGGESQWKMIAKGCELPDNTTVFYNSTGWTTNYKVGDIIQFGSYPQSKVTDSTTISALNSKAPDWSKWTSYSYYSGTGSFGTMVQGNWMRYTDIEYNGNKYRGVKFTKYRPDSTYYNSSINEIQYNNGYSINTVYWFKYEYIDWRILDPNTKLIMCETIIDSQPYSNTLYLKNSTSIRYDCFNDSSYKYYANDYETSSIRKWLNEDFYNTAFSDSEKMIINTTTLNNDGYFTSNGTTGYEKLDSNETKDKIFLISYNDARNNKYGFSSSSSVSDAARFALGSDYAQNQGLYVEKNSQAMGFRKSSWYLRSPGWTAGRGCGIYTSGGMDYSFSLDSTSTGIRPALCLSTIVKPDKYTAKHLEFITKNNFYLTSAKTYNFAKEMATLKDTKKYNYSKVLAFDFGDNYYDAVLTDLMLQQTTEEEIEEIAIEFTGKEELNVVGKIASCIKDLVEQYNKTGEITGKIQDDAISELIHGALDTNSNSYKLLKKLLKIPEANKKLKGVLNGIDKAQKVGGLIGVGIDSINELVQCLNYVTSINAYINFDKEFRSMFEYTRSKVGDNNKKLSASMNSYIRSSQSPVDYAEEVFIASLEMGRDVACIVFQKIFLKTFISGLAKYTAGTALGTLLASKVAGCTVSGCISAATLGITLGVGIGGLITNMSAVTEHMGMVVAVGELAKYVEKTMNDFEFNLSSEPTHSNAALFDRAFNFYKDCQIYSYQHTQEALYEEKSSFLYSVFFPGKVKNYETLIDELGVQKKSWYKSDCHKTHISDLKINGIDSFYYYTGSSITPEVKIDGLDLNKDYTVKYENNKTVGQASVVIKGTGEYYKGKVAKTFDIVLAATTKISTSKTSSSVTLTWNKVKGATGYRIYKKTASGWKKLGDTTKLMYTENNLESETKYTYAVRAYITLSKVKMFAKDYKTVSITTAKKPVVSKVTSLSSSSTSNSVTLKWKAVSNAEEYEVLYSSDGKEWYKYTVSKNKTTIKKLTSCTAYKFKVRAVAGNQKGSYSSIVTVITKPEKVELKDLKSTESRTLVIEWKKISGATVYELQYSTSKNFTSDTTKTYTTKKSSTKKVTIKNLIKGKKYYIKVRACTMIGGSTVYGDWSDSKSLKVI